jgi:hypothetical protein
MGGFFEHGCAGVSFRLRLDQLGMALVKVFFLSSWLQLRVEWRTMEVSSFLGFPAAVQN